MRTVFTVVFAALSFSLSGFSQTVVTPHEEPSHTSVEMGHVIHKVLPEYPADAQARDLQGSVMVKATIQRDGTLRDLSALTGPDELRGAAVAAVSQWVYTPFTIDGDPTVIDTLITVNFALAHTHSPRVLQAAAEIPPPPLPHRMPVLESRDDSSKAIPAEDRIADDRIADGDEEDAPDHDAEDAPVMVADREMEAMLIHQVAPEIPEQVRQTAAPVKTMKLHVIVNAQGKVEWVNAISGPPALRPMVEDAVAQWAYKPYSREGHAVRVDTTVQVALAVLR